MALKGIMLSKKIPDIKGSHIPFINILEMTKL